MKQNFLKLLAVATLFICFQIQAGVLIEPYAGYAFNGDGEIGTTELEYSSPTYGGRLGYQHLGFMIGADYSLQAFEMDITYANGTTAKADYKTSKLGAFIGYNFPMMLRIWGTYFLMGNLEGDGSSNSGTEYKDGAGFALGLGYKVAPFVSLNAEYRTIEYDTLELNGVEQTSYNNKLKHSEVLVSVSFPFNI